MKIRHLIFTALAAAVLPASAQQLVVPDTIAQRALACVACHGKEGRSTSEGFFPRIAGKPEGYLYNQLLNFQQGRRQYPLMTYLVAHMPDDYLREIAGYFASQHPPYPAPAPSRMSGAALERGRTLALTGDSSKKIPACVACHGQTLGGQLPATPGLLGLPRDYLNAQLGAWKNGTRRAAAPDCMAQVSRQLSPDDAAAVAGWLAAQPVPASMAPAPATSIRLPLACGSVPQSHGN
ncbi:c-type cytochrome [Massilia sp. RP-1-19]|uniref:C-type cytochrome n=1 Tax=Massilia polaris TaxID=2728846 RepID=A0A848HMZ2_9BURK|nr:c-type cytochrome [Massilia polaris]NML59898.1 c-type cytochrome [Massilia polaris]